MIKGSHIVNALYSAPKLRHEGEFFLQEHDLYSSAAIPWESGDVDVQHDIEQARDAYRHWQRQSPSVMLPKALLDRFGISEEDAKEQFGDSIIFL